MNPLWRTLRRIIADLCAADVRFALVGGLAASSRTAPRFTRDVDLAVAAEAVALIQSRGFARGRDLGAALAQLGRDLD